MMKIGKHGIKIDDLEQVEAVLAEVNGPRASKWVADFLTVTGISAKADKKLDAAGLSASARIGAVVEFYGHVPDTKAYKYAVKTTHFKLRLFKDGWRLAHAEEAYRHPTSSRNWRVLLTDLQIYLVAKIALEGFHGIQGGANRIPNALESLQVAA
ncbi:hypothetical protein GCM10011491_34820 [Brucella endophytica]|uniref:Uncharacterized protein n=1 Tax=Brucella endophytica TaxID=1963359 RepID=A0A916WJL5_9HYPH|nr:hypothetical protein [Brucella endophytica]GGB03683.1 hypothetical protein GCM10011491_34820 [Brucella endophytica]